MEVEFEATWVTGYSSIIVEEDDILNLSFNRQNTLPIEEGKS